LVVDDPHPAALVKVDVQRLANGRLRRDEFDDEAVLYLELFQGLRGRQRIAAGERGVQVAQGVVEPLGLPRRRRPGRRSVGRMGGNGENDECEAREKASTHGRDSRAARRRDTAILPLPRGLWQESGAARLTNEHLYTILGRWFVCRKGRVPKGMSQNVSKCLNQKK